MHVMYDSIIQGVAAEKAQDMAEVGITMNAWKYCAERYGEDEKTAKAQARGQKQNKDCEKQAATGLALRNPSELIGCLSVVIGGLAAALLAAFLTTLSIRLLERVSSSPCCSYQLNL